MNKSHSKNNSFERPINWRVNDFCHAHGIGRTTFYEEVKNGDLKVIKLGSTTLVTDVDAKEWQARKICGGVK